MSSAPPICSITSEQEQKWLPKLSRYYVPDHICPFVRARVFPYLSRTGTLIVLNIFGPNNLPSRLMRRGVLQGVLKSNMWSESSIVLPCQFSPSYISAIWLDYLGRRVDVPSGKIRTDPLVYTRLLNFSPLRGPA
ncbi:hypothetical protein PTI98_008520 [Pleurotus ostreatus]|nr:hypothetical protein PTI98_008520 [Pleurotus ostreatus]